MKKVLATVKPLHFSRWLVITFDEKWLDLFDGELVFECSITDRILQIRSTKEVILNEYKE